MEYVLKPSLKRMTLIKICVELWNQEDVRALIVKLSSVNFYKKHDSWENIENVVIKKVPQLLQPEILKQNIIGFVKPIGIEILNWMKFHRRGFYLHLDLPAEFYWTPQGTVDRKKVAEVLVKDENLEISQRYKLACIYCLEDDISKLWGKMPKNLKESFSHEESQNNSCWQCVVSYWTRNMKRKESNNACVAGIYALQFQMSVKAGNKTATEYFLKKLISCRKVKSFIMTTSRVQDAEVLIFLLSKMDNEQQIEVFKNSPFSLLRCILSWPYQSFFLGTVDRILPFIPEQHFSYLLQDIIEKIKDGFLDYNYPSLFIEILQKNPNALSSYQSERYQKAVHQILFHTRDKNIVSLLIKDSLLYKKKFIHSTSALAHCCHLISEDRWELLDCLIKLCLPTKNNRLEFKEKFEKLLTSPSVPEIFEDTFRRVKDCVISSNKDKWEQLFVVFDNSTGDQDKRAVDEDENSYRKRLRSSAIPCQINRI